MTLGLSPDMLGAATVAELKAQLADLQKRYDASQRDLAAHIGAYARAQEMIFGLEAQVVELRASTLKQTALQLTEDYLALRAEVAELRRWKRIDAIAPEWLSNGLPDGVGLFRYEDKEATNA